MTRVLLAIEASADLQAIWDYLAPRSATGARRTIDRIDARFQLLQQSPESGELRTDITTPFALGLGHAALAGRVARDLIKLGVQLTSAKLVADLYLCAALKILCALGGLRHRLRHWLSGTLRDFWILV